MVRVVGIDHLVISVGDFETSKKFYAPLMAFLGFGVEAEYEGSMMGWANGKTLFWIAAADAQGKKHTYRKGDIGFHHYAFRLRSRADVDALQAYLEGQGATIVDPAGEYYDDYYADPYYANYPYDSDGNFVYNGGYYGTGCTIIQRRTPTPYGWVLRPVQVCE